MVIGITVPSREDPMATKPMAVPRLNLNQCAMTAVVGPNMPPHANYVKRYMKETSIGFSKIRTPAAKPWQRRNCQYSLHSAVRNVAVTRRALEVKKMDLKYPRSNNRPTSMPGTKFKAYCQDD